MTALEHALALPPQAIVDAITASGLRGRGGAAFPAGIKWQTVLDTPAAQKYIVCNADEGDSGTFADRLLMEADPFQLIEGMTIIRARGGRHPRLHLPALGVSARARRCSRERSRSRAARAGSGRRYPRQRAELRARTADRRRRLHLRRGDGPAGEPRGAARHGAGQAAAARGDRPVRPADGGEQRADPRGRHDAFSSVARAFYRDYGMGRSRGTLPLQLGGNVRRGGLVELAFGATLRELVEDFGGGTLSGRPMRAIQVGGPLGAYLPASAVGHAAGLRGVRGRRGACSATAGWWSSTTRSTCASRRASRWSSARTSPAASARPAASAPRAASR